MKNHYYTLGISRYASQIEIKSAYKKLAFKYHPDRNPSNTFAEELFKEVNEAYHILSNPLKKERYDRLIEFGSFKSNNEPLQKQSFYTYSRPVRRRRNTPAYTFDKSYFKHQGLAILFVLIIAALVMTVTQAQRYFDEAEKEEIRIANQKVLSTAQAMFSIGDFYNAIQLIQGLASKQPENYELNLEREKMIKELYQKARRQFVLQDYENAVYNLLIVKEFQQPQNLETYEYLARSYNALHEYKKAVATYEYIYLRDKENIDLIMRIAMLYHYQIKKLDMAISYYDIAKKLFKERQSQLYGKAFELLMDPKHTPDLYFYIFYHRAKANIESQDFHTAVTDCNWATFLRPDQAEPFFLRALSYAQIENFHRACQDYNTAVQKGYVDESNYSFCR